MSDNQHHRKQTLYRELEYLINDLSTRRRVYTDYELRSLEKALRSLMVARGLLRDVDYPNEGTGPTAPETLPQIDPNFAESEFESAQLYKLWQEQHKGLGADFDGDRFPRPLACDQDYPPKSEERLTGIGPVQGRRLLQKVDRFEFAPPGPKLNGPMPWWDYNYQIVPPSEPKPITGCFGEPEGPEVKY